MLYTYFNNRPFYHCVACTWRCVGTGQWRHVTYTIWCTCSFLQELGSDVSMSTSEATLRSSKNSSRDLQRGERLAIHKGVAVVMVTVNKKAVNLRRRELVDLLNVGIHFCLLIVFCMQSYPVCAVAVNAVVQWRWVVSCVATRLRISLTRMCRFH